GDFKACPIGTGPFELVSYDVGQKVVYKRREDNKWWDGEVFLDGVEFIKAIDDGKLPSVSFYKPQGNLNEHGGYADVTSGDKHLADIVSHLEKSPQWPHMLVVVTYDENGGFWDHVAPPRADRWGPGNRIPAFIISPYAKLGTVDHTQYDTTSILRFITNRYELPVLQGIV
ncbi:MAG: hypothetical protein E5W30_13475, partial [Mesorhizobium sp.]